jgi:hypothetical protein
VRLDVDLYALARDTDDPVLWLPIGGQPIDLYSYSPALDTDDPVSWLARTPWPAAAAPASNDKSGTVTGSTTSTGIIVGKDGALGSVTGSTTISGTIVGTAKRAGVVTGDTTSTGTITGTKFDPTPPPASSTSGGGPRRYSPSPVASYPPVRKSSGKVRGRTVSYAHVRGQATRRALPLPAETRSGALVLGTRGADAVVLGRAALTTRLHATRRELRLSVYHDPDAEVRRARDDADLLLIL